VKPAIAKLNVVIALALTFAFGACKAANAPVVDAPVVIPDSDRSAISASSGDASQALDFHAGAGDPIVDAAPPPIAIVEVEDAAAFGPVGDQAHHEKITLPVRGHYMVLGATATVTVASPGGKRHVALIELPSRGSYFLDNVYVDRWGMRGGDVMYCVPLQSRTIDLVEYVDEGPRWSLLTGHQYEKQQRVSSYRTTDLRGVIDIEIDYFADAKCRVPKVFRKRIQR
jgi:hypothetical protein